MPRPNDASREPHSDGAGALEATVAALAYLRDTGAAALVTVIETWGSAPVPTGGQMAVAADGRFAGSVSGGCIEGDILVAAERAIADRRTRVLAFGVDDATAWRVGLPCGGNIRVMVEPLTAADGAMLERLATAARAREVLAVATDIATGGRRLLTREEIDLEVARGALSADLGWRLKGGDSRLVPAPAGEAGATREVFYKTYAPPARLVIIGATHIAQVLVALAATAGYGAIIIDPRDAYASVDRFHGVEIIADSPGPALERVGLDASTAVVALAHVIHIDDEALMAALRAPCVYVGVLGSRKNRDRRRERLTAAGFAASDIDRIRSPIGLDIGALTPAEIAVAILAEVIETVRGKRRG